MKKSYDLYLEFENDDDFDTIAIDNVISGFKFSYPTLNKARRAIKKNKDIISNASFSASINTMKVVGIVITQFVNKGWYLSSEEVERYSVKDKNLIKEKI